jgi:hypothetical protein
LLLTRGHSWRTIRPALKRNGRPKPPAPRLQCRVTDTEAGESGRRPSPTRRTDTEGTSAHRRFSLRGG